MAVRRTVAALVLVVLAVLGWLLLAPQQLGGPVAVVSTYGTSMLPTYTASDLVVVAKAGEYDVGDVVAYRSDEMGVVVLHRIVDVDDAGYVTQGDNNDWLDPDRPTDEELMGTARFHVPGAGRMLDVPAPVRAAGITVLAGLALFGGARPRRRRSRRPAPDTPSEELLPATPRGRARRRPGRRPRSARREAAVPAGTGWVGWPLTTAVVATTVGLLAALLAVAAFTRPSTAPGDLDYRHRGTFTYTADAPRGLTYPTGRVTTGDPVFLRLIDQLDLAFSYELVGPGAAVEPTGQLWLDLTDGSGWSTRSSLSSAEAGEDGTLHLEGTLDVPRLRRMLADVQEETGISAGAGTLTVTADIEVAGRVAGEPVADRFAPELVLELGEHRLGVQDGAGTAEPDPDGAGGDADGDAAGDGIVRTQTGSVTLPDAEPARLELAGRGTDVGTARVLALTLLGAALLALTVAAVAARRQRTLDEAGRIQRRYGRRFIEVAALEIPAGYGIVDVRDVASLVTLADRNDRPLLHHRSPAADTYLVEGDATVYRYRVVSPDAPPDDAAPVDDPPVDDPPVDAAPVAAPPVDAAPVDAAPVDAGPVDAAPVTAPRSGGRPAVPDRAPLTRRRRRRRAWSRRGAAPPR